MVTGTHEKRVEIAGRLIGDGRCFVIAEAGVNHNGDLAMAHRLVDVAADAGADAVKFQTFDPHLLVAVDAPKAEYQKRTTGAAESQFDMLRKLVLPLEAYAALVAHARERGILFLSTAFDEASADFLHSLGLPAFKIPSGEITNAGLVRHVARLGRPVLLSTGMSTEAEVGEAVRTVLDAGAPSLALFHCVSSYPAPAEDCNLRAMETMRAAFGVPVGWSDHTQGVDISLAAIAAGAEILEKHITLDRALPGPDHAASIEPHELTALVHGTRVIELAMGDGVKRPRPAELPLIPVARRSLHASRALAAGTTLSATDFVALRPGSGVSPTALPRIVGRSLRRPLAHGDLLREDDVA